MERGKAIVFGSEEMAMKAILGDTVKKGHVIVIRYEGPKGGPGMREMLSPTSAIMGKGLGKDVALITDGDIDRDFKIDAGPQPTHRMSVPGNK